MSNVSGSVRDLANLLDIAGVSGEIIAKLSKIEKGLPTIIIDTAANRPAAGTADRVFIETDTGRVLRDTGAAWDEMGLSESQIALANLASRAHADLTNIGAADHHTYPVPTTGITDDAVTAPKTAAYDDAADEWNFPSIVGTDLQYDSVVAAIQLGLPVVTGDVDAPNDSVFFNSTDNAFKYKDSGGTVRTRDHADLTGVSEAQHRTLEQLQDHVGAMAGTLLTYDDVNAAIDAAVAHSDLSGVTPSQHHAKYIDEEAQDAVGLNVGSGLAYDDPSGAISASLALGDLTDVTATGEGSGGGFDADTVDGSHASGLGAPAATEIYNPDSVSTRLQIYDISADTWSSSSENTDLENTGIAGDNNGNLYTPSVGATRLQIYDIAANSWTVSSTNASLTDAGVASGVY